MKAIKEIGIKRALRYVFFSLWEYLFFLMFISPLRVWLLRISGAKVGGNTVVERIAFMNLYRTGLKGLTLGRNCFLGNGVVLDMADRIILGDSVTLSANTLVLTHTNVGYKNHPLQRYIRSTQKPIKFKNGSFVGVKCVIFPGVTIGRSSAVAAGAVVNSDVKDKFLVGGIPAKKIKEFI